jgi:hypothetical protein
MGVWNGWAVGNRFASVEGELLRHGAARDIRAVDSGHSRAACAVTHALAQSLLQALTLNRGGFTVQAATLTVRDLTWLG